jgi:hypothetical protein
VFHGKTCSDMGMESQHVPNIESIETLQLKLENLNMASVEYLGLHANKSCTPRDTSQPGMLSLQMLGMCVVPMCQLHYVQ